MFICTGTGNIYIYIQKEMQYLFICKSKYILGHRKAGKDHDQSVVRHGATFTAEVRADLYKRKLYRRTNLSTAAFPDMRESELIYRIQTRINLEPDPILVLQKIKKATHINARRQKICFKSVRIV